MNKKDVAIAMLLSDPYVSSNVIAKVLGTSHYTAVDIFDHVKKKELETMPIINGKPLDMRPTKIPTKILLKELRLDYNFIKKQFDSKREYKNEQV